MSTVVRRGVRPMLTVNHRTRQGGQALVLMVLAMVAVISGMALIIDGGNAWAQQRITQSGNDAASEAGTIKFWPGATPAVRRHRSWLGCRGAGGDQSLCDEQRRHGPCGYGYGTPCGLLHGHLRNTPSPEWHEGDHRRGCRFRRRRHLADQQPHRPRLPERRRRSRGRGPGVGFASLRHVRVAVMGISTFTSTTNATAVTGLLQDCSAAQGCIVLPVTAPVTVVTCASNGEAEIANGVASQCQSHRAALQEQSRQRRLARLDAEGWRSE